MPRARLLVPVFSGLVAVVLAGTACSVKASIGTDDTTTTSAAVTTASRVTTTTSDGGSGGDAPAVGTTETVGDYTLTIIDPGQSGLSAPQGVTAVDAAKITKGDQPIGLLVKYTVDGSVSDENVRDILASAGGGSQVTSVTINGKQGYAVTLASGQVVIARATESGDIGLVAGVPGVSADQLGQAVADITN